MTSWPENQGNIDYGEFPADIFHVAAGEETRTMERNRKRAEPGGYQGVAKMVRSASVNGVGVFEKMFYCNKIRDVWGCRTGWKEVP